MSSGEKATMSLVCRWFLVIASVEVCFSPWWTTFASPDAGIRTPRQPPKSKNNDLREQCPSLGRTEETGLDYGHPQFVSDWKKDWRQAQSSDEMNWKQSGCIKIPENLSLCQGVGYSGMHLPNLLGQEDMARVKEEAASWVPLLSTRCHPDTKIFLCSLIAPICHTRPVWPCRTLCLAVKASCEPAMLRSGLKWPLVLSCDRLPSDHLCIGNQTQRSKGEDRCRACDQSDTLDGIVDQFCRVDTVLRLSVDRLEISDSNVKIFGSKIKILKNRNSQTKEKNPLKFPMTVDSGSKCSCHPLWNRSEVLVRSGNETQYLVMGMTRKDRVQVSFLRPFNASSPAMIRAMSAIRKETVCRNGFKNLVQQSAKNKKKSKKKETKQKIKIKKKEIKQKLKARKEPKAEMANEETTPQNKKKTKTVENNRNQANKQHITPVND